MHRPDHRSDLAATEPRTDPMAALATSPFGRRRFLVIGGASVTGAALLAACGGDKPEVARVGEAPATTEQPKSVVNDVVLLRTASSLEHTLLAVYESLGADGLLPAPFADLAARFKPDHEAAAEVFEQLTTAAGGTPWTDENPRMRDVTLPPVLRRITGAEANDTFPAATRSDDPERDAAHLIHALETLSAASYQAFLPMLSMPEQRKAAAAIASEAARRSAVLAIAITGAPEAYVNPESVEEATGSAPTTTAAPTTTQNIAAGATEDTAAPAVEATAIPTVYAIPSQYGQLSAVQMVLGAPNESGTRLTVNLETPSNNTFVYEFMS